jgi:hypothetical protein
MPSRSIDENYTSLANSPSFCSHPIGDIEGKPRAIYRIAPLARVIADVIECARVLNRFGVSSLIIATKKPV